MVITAFLSQAGRQVIKHTQFAPSLSLVLLFFFFFCCLFFSFIIIVILVSHWGVVILGCITIVFFILLFHREASRVEPPSTLLYSVFPQHARACLFFSSLVCFSRTAQWCSGGLIMIELLLLFTLHHNLLFSFFLSLLFSSRWHTSFVFSSSTPHANRVKFRTTCSSCWRSCRRAVLTISAAFFPPTSLR